MQSRSRNGRGDGGMDLKPEPGVPLRRGARLSDFRKPAPLEGALPPYPLRYPRPFRPTDIACFASSVPASGGRVETRHRLCCGTRSLSRSAPNLLKQSSHPCGCAFGPALLPPPGCLRHRLPSQVEPRRPTVASALVRSFILVCII